MELVAERGREPKQPLHRQSERKAGFARPVPLKLEVFKPNKLCFLLEVEKKNTKMNLIYLEMAIIVPL